VTHASSGGPKAHPVLNSLDVSRRHAQNLLTGFGLAPNGRPAPKSSAGAHSYRYK
jgi:hypothetical protein